MRTVDLVRDLRTARPEMSVLLTAHDMEVIFALAERVLLMAEGVIRVEGTPDEVGSHPLTREIYLGSGVTS
jgi:branched-chain amino acid transport system ATP-binding protein